MGDEDLKHFVAIVESMAAEGKTIQAALDRLCDEGLTKAEANTVVQAYMTTCGTIDV